MEGSPFTNLYNGLVTQNCYPLCPETRGRRCKQHSMTCSAHQAYLVDEVNPVIHSELPNPHSTAYLLDCQLLPGLAGQASVGTNVDSQHSKTQEVGQICKAEGDIRTPVKQQLQE